MTDKIFYRFQTLGLQKKFRALEQQVISYGSCQFPTVGFVVERYKAIENFVPEPFWKLKVIHQANPQCKVEFAWNRVRLSLNFRRGRGRKQKTNSRGDELKIQPRKQSIRFGKYWY